MQQQFLLSPPRLDLFLAQLPVTNFLCFNWRPGCKLQVFRWFSLMFGPVFQLQLPCSAQYSSLDIHYQNRTPSASLAAFTISLSLPTCRLFVSLWVLPIVLPLQIFSLFFLLLLLLYLQQLTSQQKFFSLFVLKWFLMTIVPYFLVKFVFLYFRSNYMKTLVCSFHVNISLDFPHFRTVSSAKSHWDFILRLFNIL